LMAEYLLVGLAVTPKATREREARMVDFITEVGF
jgi:hypothetical protein